MAIKTKEQDARVHHGILYSVEASGLWSIVSSIISINSSLPAQLPFSRKTTFRFEFNGTESVRLWSVIRDCYVTLLRRLLINYELCKK